MSVPSLLDALVSVATSALEESADKIIRIQDLVGITPARVIATLDPNAAMRFGLTMSVGKANVRRSGVTDDARQITRWRNGSVAVRRARPIVILGTASGREEAGLRKARSIIREADFLREFGKLLGRYLETLVESQNPKNFARALLQMAQDGLIDPTALEKYCVACFANEQAAVHEPQLNLWQLRLIPDPRALDHESPGTRLSLNYRVVEFLRNQPDTQSDEKQLLRLEQAAEAKNSLAIAALLFRSSGDRKYLKSITLDGILSILNPGGKKKDPGGKRYLDIFDALDGAHLDEATIDSVGDAWDLSTSSLSHSADLEGDIVLRVTADALEERVTLGNNAEDQVIATQRTQEVSLADARKYFGRDLIQAAAMADTQEGRTVYAPLVEKLTAARVEVLPLIRWADSLLECLILKPTLLAQAEDYLLAWEQFVDEILGDPESAAVAGLRRITAALDGHWEVSADKDGFQQAEAVELLPIHPFVLKPIVDLAVLARSSLEDEHLGTQLLWAYDRTLPAYPAVWMGAEVLVHQEGSTSPVFSRRPRSVQPPVTSKSGLSEVIRSFVGLHPFTTKHLTILLIDPPPGGGVGRAISDVIRSRLVDDATVYIANTGAMQSELPGVPAQVEHLGMQKDFKKWADAGSVTAHIVVWFQRPRLAEGGSHAGVMQPSRGLHNALTVALISEPANGLFGVSTECKPQVSVQPRDSNSVVRKLMELSRQSQGADRLYQVSPMLPADQADAITSLTTLADWVVVGAPGPMGLVPPRRLSDERTVYLGGEEMGNYGLFVFTGDLFSVRRKIQDQLIKGPLAPDSTAVEKQIEALALSTPNGVLRLGRSATSVLAQVGLVAASHFAEGIARGR